MNTIKKTTLMTLAGVASLAAFEYDYATAIENQDFAGLLKNGGTLYKNSDNSFVQKIKVYGRAQYQTGTVFADGENFNFNEFRRSRLGLEVSFLEHFKWKGNADLENGGTNSVDFDTFTGWDDAGLYADLAGLLDLDGFDKLSLFVGKTKHKIGHDVRSSSTSIKTVERTRWTDNGLRPANSTGVLLTGKASGVEFATGFFSNTSDGDFHFWKNDGASFLYGSVGFGAGAGDVIADFVVSFDSEDSSKNTFKNDYSWSLAYVQDLAGWETAFNIGGAEDFNGGSLFGASVLTHKKVTEKLELVGRLSFATGDHSSLDASSRYARSSTVVGGELDLNADTGVTEDAFNAYVGVNYYFVGDNSKVLVGLEYDDVSDAANTTGNEDAITLSAAYRFKF